MAEEVFLVTHLPAEGEATGLKVLGVYATEEAARAAIERAIAHPAFHGQQDFYWIDHYEIGKDDWPLWTPQS